jgi:uncharacterized membrane protein YphA (DoxX/SURF4 family)
MSNVTVVGLTPWLPWPLTRWTWWTEPVRAERLAALRIGMAAVLLFDLFGTYMPLAGDFFGRGSLGSPEVFDLPTAFRWSVLRRIEDPTMMQAALALWGIAAAFLLVGAFARFSAAVAWLMSISIMGLNYYLHNSGDNVRTIGLFYLMLCPCGAAWSLGNYRAWHKGRREPVYVSAWALRLVFVQMALIYFLNGLYKLAGSHWREGDMLQCVMGNVAWTRISAYQLSLPLPVVQLLTWSVLIWELGFPLLVQLPWLRTSVLWMGVGFHVGTGVFLPLGPFPLYMLCLYLPLIPWECYVDRWRERVEMSAARPLMDSEQLEQAMEPEQVRPARPQARAAAEARLPSPQTHHRA